MVFNFERLKEIRQKRGFTLAQASQASGYTASFLSQLERGLKEPSLTTLRKLAAIYSIPLVSLFVNKTDDTAQQEQKSGKAASRQFHIIRGDERKEIVIPKVLTTCEFVTPLKLATENLTGLSGYIVKLKPKCWISEKLVSHTADESTYVISGKMKAVVDNEVYYLSAGDSIYVEANVLHNWQNCGKEVLEVISYMAIGI